MKGNKSEELSLESWIVEKVGRGQKSRIDKRRENRVAVFRFQRFVSNVKGLERERERETPRDLQPSKFSNFKPV